MENKEIVIYSTFIDDLSQCFQNEFFVLNSNITQKDTEMEKFIRSMNFNIVNNHEIINAYNSFTEYVKNSFKKSDKTLMHKKIKKDINSKEEKKIEKKVINSKEEIKE